MKNILISVAVAALPLAANAQITEFNLEGNAGFGLLPGNEVGSNTATAATSSASGGETGGGFVFDASTNTLSFEFEFSGLSGGLFDAASGIHFHGLTAAGMDPFNETAGIAFNLNSGGDPNVTLSSPTLMTGPSTTAGSLSGTATFSDAANVTALFDGRYYLNIHSGDFTGGELRGNLVPVPEPSTYAAIFGALLVGVYLLRRRRS